MPTHRKNARIFKCKILKTHRKDGEPRYRVNLPKALMESNIAKNTHFYATVEIDTYRKEIIFALEENQHQIGVLKKPSA